MPSGGEEINAVQRGDDLAPNQQFFQSLASPQFLFLHDTLPKREGLLLTASEGKIGIQLHALLLAAGVPTAAEKSAREGKEGVANGTRTRNSQNHNLGLYH